jgi:signal recognition particle GTPase
VDDLKFGRSPTNSLLWDRNLGSDYYTLLHDLKTKLGLKISARSLRVDDSYIHKGLELLAKKLMTHNLDYGITDRIARELRRELKKLVSKEKIEEVVERVYCKFFPGEGIP